MLFESVLVTALLAADLTVPSQTLEAFRLHLVCDVLRASYFCFRHVGGVDSDPEGLFGVDSCLVGSKGVYKVCLDKKVSRTCEFEVEVLPRMTNCMPGASRILPHCRHVKSHSRV